MSLSAEPTQGVTAPKAAGASGASVAGASVAAEARIAVDRVACTGHGICAHLLPDSFDLDEWGYPVVVDDRVPERDAATAVKMCPARALYLRTAG